MKGLDTHKWVRPISVAYMPGAMTPALEQILEALLDWLEPVGCTIQSEPTNETDLIITTTRYGLPIERQAALFFQAKRMYRLRHRPPVLTVIDLPETEYHRWLDHFASLAQNGHRSQTSFQYPALGPQAVEVLLEQAKRGGPEVALGRFLQGYVKSFRVMAVRSEAGERPVAAIHFDLAGAHPTTLAVDLPAFAEEVGLRILAAACTEEVDHHDHLADPVPQQLWQQLTTPEAMIRAGTVFTEFDFFTTPVSIEKLLGYRDVNEAVSAQYSEGCYAVFDPDIPGLITTATGSAQLVDKRAISRNDQAIVVGVKPEKDGAIVRPVEGRGRIVPSVEAVEMMRICQAVPSHSRRNNLGNVVEVPNVRAILHGHLGVAAFNPELVESVTLPSPYYTHLVSCGTGALAEGTESAFGRSAALQNLDDPRKVIFLEQPGHGVVVVEKWVEGKQPFEVIHDFLTEGHLKMTLEVPQGEVAWEEQTRLDGSRVRQKAGYVAVRR